MPKVSTILLVVLALLPVATAGQAVDSLGSHTIVVKGLPAPTQDRGSVICRADGLSVGGACIPFSVGDAILVTDDKALFGVAFQVCLDHNGDGVCGGSGRSGADGCADEIFFSHNDAGLFYNPLGALPKGFKSGCPGGPFPGSIVFICDGIHAVQGQPPHTHIAPKGEIILTGGGTGIDSSGKGLGTFCGGTQDTPPKPYYLR